MKKVHTITFSHEEIIKHKLKKIGIPVRDDFTLNFKVAEDDSQWDEVKKLMKEFHGLDICHVQFTPKELRAVSWLVMTPRWHHGYPQPEDDYREKTYNLTSYCEKCGIGKFQKYPFRMMKEPRWGARHILQLNWVFDAYFVKPDVWEQVFKPKGVGGLPVLHHKTGTTLKTVVQLKVDTILDDGLEMNGFPYEVCKKCNRKKYLPISYSAFPPMKGVPRDIHAAKSKEYFGSGAAAFRAFFISQALYAEIDKHQLKGVDFVVVDEKSN